MQETLKIKLIPGSFLIFSILKPGFRPHFSQIINANLPRLLRAENLSGMVSALKFLIKKKKNSSIF